MLDITGRDEVLLISSEQTSPNLNDKVLNICYKKKKIAPLREMSLGLKQNKCFHVILF